MNSGILPNGSKCGLVSLFAGDSVKQKGIKSLIVTPTRELAIQIQESIKNYSKYTKIQSTVIFGGVKQQKQILELEKKQKEIIKYYQLSKALDMAGSGGGGGGAVKKAAGGFF